MPPPAGTTASTRSHTGEHPRDGGKMRLALITNFPSPYRIPVWDALARKAGRLKVFLCSEFDGTALPPPQAVSFEYIGVPGLRHTARNWEWDVNFNPGLWMELDRFRPDAVLLSSYESPSYLLALFYARMKNIPVTIWWGTHVHSRRLRGKWSEAVKRWILNRFDTFSAMSRLAKDYLVAEMGIPDHRIIRSINTVDVRHWHELAAKRPPTPDIATRPLRFLYMGQFIERKGLLELLDAFRAISAEQGCLRLVGRGAQEPLLREFIAQHRLDHVQIAGATRTMKETAVHYSWADVLVLPSNRELWGLVVNEALACGVYVMVSRFAGAAFDMIEQAPFDVGVSFDPTRRQDFVEALLAVSEKRSALDRDKIASWGLRHTPEIYADQLWSAVSLAVDLKRGRP